MQSRYLDERPIVRLLLAASPIGDVKDWPAQRDLADRITAAGWSRATWHNLSGGIIAIHAARRPPH